MSVAPKVEALGVNRFTCGVVIGTSGRKAVYCGEPASFRLTWTGLPPLCMCLDHYESDQESQGDTPTVGELRGEP